MILNIKDKNATLNIDSYVEILQKELQIKKQTENQIELKEIDSDKTLIFTKTLKKLL